MEPKSAYRRHDRRVGARTIMMNSDSSIESAGAASVRELVTGAEGEPTLDQKVEFLSRPAAYARAPAVVTRRETHMSWVFFVGDRVYKLKKPVRFPYLDFSTLPRREAACRAELRLNRRLASDVYLAVEPLTATHPGLAIGAHGAVVDWLVVMRRLDESHTLERAIQERRVQTWQLDRLVATLVPFYRRRSQFFGRPTSIDAIGARACPTIGAYCSIRDLGCRRASCGVSTASSAGLLPAEASS